MSEKRTRSPKVRLGLVVTTETDSNWFMVKAYPVTLGPNTWEQECRTSGSYAYPDIKDDTVRNPDDRKQNGLYLNNLIVVSQGNNNDERRHLYGWEVRYQSPYAVDLEKAEHMVKTLRTVHARMAATDKKLGRPTTFGQFIARVAEAIGADQFLIDETPKRGSHSGWFTHAEAGYRWQDIEDGVRLVDYRIREWAEPKPAAVAVAS